MRTIEMWGVVQRSTNLVASSVSIGQGLLISVAMPWGVERLHSTDRPAHFLAYMHSQHKTVEGVGASFPKMQMLSFILMESGLLMIRCRTHLPIYFPPLSPPPLLNLSPFPTPLPLLIPVHLAQSGCCKAI